MTRLIDADALKESLRLDLLIKGELNYDEVIDLITNAPTIQVDILNITKVLEGYKAPEPLPVIPLTHAQLSTPFGTGRTVQRDGWVSVPIEPTEEMKRALFRNLIYVDDEAYVIKAIIAAAPTGKE